MTVVSSDPLSRLEFSTAGGPHWASSENLRPSLPLSSYPLPFLYPVLLRGAWMTNERGNHVKMAGAVGVVGHRIPQSQPVGWEAESSQISPHAPCARLCVGLFGFPAYLSFHSPCQACWGAGGGTWGEHRRSLMQEMGGVKGHGFVSHTPEREPWCQLTKRDVVKKEIYAQVHSQDGVGFHLSE